MSKNGKRMSFVLPENSFNRLKNLQEISEASTKTDVIRSSLRLYEWMVQEAQKGNTFFMRSEDGNEKPIMPFAMY